LPAARAEDRNWGRSHKQGGAAGKPCPAPPEALAKRASNRVISTTGGFAQAYTDSKLNDPAARLETGISILQSKMKIPDIEPKGHYSGLQSCTTNVDYWNDCDG
jgi:hypothetical protein